VVWRRMEQPEKRSSWLRRTYNSARGMFVAASKPLDNAYANVTGAKGATVVKEFHDDMEQVYAAIVTRIIRLEVRQRRVTKVAWTGVMFAALSAAIWVGHWIGYLR
jgi:hypothetical protein